jgi:RNA polymerase sigma-70 factor (ECF subfamily)
VGVSDLLDSISGLYLIEGRSKIAKFSGSKSIYLKGSQKGLGVWLRTLLKVNTQELKKKHDGIFEREFLPHMDILYNFAYHLAYNESDANDLVQETYLKAYRFIESYQEGTNAKAWLFKILKNAFINEYRKRSKQPTKIDYEEIVNYQDAEDSSYVEYVDLRQEIFQGMIGDEVSNALNSLPVDFRTVVLLCDIEGFTYEEIASIVDIPIGTVRSRLHRARNMLKEQLKAYAKEMGFRDKR